MIMCTDFLQLCDYAQSWADHLMDNNKFQHRPDSKYGENIFSSWTSCQEAAAKLSGGQAVDSWYQEVAQFTYGQRSGSPGTGHFSQVVWAGSQLLGVGVAVHKGKVMVVANYDPPGNIVGRYAENVPPPV